MKQIILNIPENRVKAFLEFLKQIPFVKVAERKPASAISKKRSFTVLKVNAKDFKFNREELNAR